MFFSRNKSEIKEDNLIRYFPVGAEILKDEGVSFRVWAQANSKIEVALFSRENDNFNIISIEELTSENNGYYSGISYEARENSLYKFRIKEGDLFPDPASRFQPSGPDGPSQVINPHSFTWTDYNWNGIKLSGQLIYEIHIGTFTPEGTFTAAIKMFPHLVDLGITIIELMPVADFPGRYGWGYDGVNLFAPTRLYGTPDNLREFINAAHNMKLGVILDVVYNHFGPDGNYLDKFSADYFTKKYKTDWGGAINFDGENSSYVREYFITNARYWIKEFHLDGFRFDATQDIHDQSPVHILKEITNQARKEAGEKSIILVAENEPQEIKLIKDVNEGGYGLDAVWNDDFHHSAMVALTGHNEAYYSDYWGKPQEFISTLKWGYLYQGQLYKWQKKKRGSPSLNINPERFITYIQNHDQIANSAKGLRAHQVANFGLYKALTTLLFLAPGTPMLFQGQEFAASTPFLYFADQKKEIAELVKTGRSEFLSQFRSLATVEMQRYLPDPSDINSFLKSKLDFNEIEKNYRFFKLHKDLIRIRKQIINSDFLEKRNFDGAVLSEECFLLRYFFPTDNDWLLLFNLGKDLHLNPAPEPLLAPPENKDWQIFWSSEDPYYGGYGTPPFETDENWKITGCSALVLTSISNSNG